MDTGIGDRENTGWHLHPATNVCARRSNGRTNRPALKCNQPESARVSETLICSLCYYATQPVCQLVMWEPKVKGKCGMHRG